MTLVKAMERNSYELSPDQHRQICEASSYSQGDVATQKHSGEELLVIHNKNIDVMKESKPSVREFVLPVAYAPSFLSLDRLQKISFKDLKLETHHRGGFITGRTIAFPYQRSEVITIIEGDSGVVIKLVLGLEDNLYSGNAYHLPINSTVAIKEPYCKYNGDGDFVIRVDHPSDIAVLRGDDETVCMIMQSAAGVIEMSPAQWRSAGDEAYLEKKYTSAVECYAQAIDNTPKDDEFFVKETYRKRAFANLTAKSFLSAKEDALASLSSTATDVRAFQCAGTATYSLGLYSESKAYFEEALKVAPHDAKIQKELLRVKTRLREQIEGIYDFASMVQAVFDGNSHLDHTTYSNAIEVRSAAGHGRGLFSTKFIKAGSLVLCEKAFCLPEMYTEDKPKNMILYNFNSTSRTQRPAQAALFLQLRQKVYENFRGGQNEAFWDLDAGGYVRSGKEGSIVDGVPVVDTFLIEAIRLKNCFSCPRLSLSLLQEHLSSSSLNPTLLSTGLWIKSSYINHSCLPNLTRAFIGDMMIIHANSDIPPNTELTHQYLAPETSYLTRRKKFPLHWDFTCDCLLCSTEATSPDEKHQQRRDLVDQIKLHALSPQNQMYASQRISKGAIKAIERLVRKLEDLHEPAVYANIPRLLLVHPTIWLTDAHRAAGNHAKVIKYALEILRNFGFVDPVREGRLCLDGEAGVFGITNCETFSALRIAAEAYRALGSVDLAAQCEDAARRMFVVLTGSGVGVDTLFGRG
ncbi:hypothetical protein VTL71DRAFT_4525 [Oculimacula yallundae]|uniref:SET domain-containing protein n=1 Tax=Oculimacula yallundae TaxID=86028 RepID=A0ABR4C266_9HELO